ncbi:MAG: glycosyltransferase [Mycobacteriales bacterium]
MNPPVRRVVATGSVGAALATAHTAWNLRHLRGPPDGPIAVAENFSVLLPVRNEADRVAACLRALLASTGVAHLEILVLDDGSTDGTADAVRRLAGGDSRLRLLSGAELPPGWLGKPFACAQLAGAASGSVYLFLDADVVVARDAIARSVALLRTADLDLVSPYPRQVAESPAERLCQPLLQWSWLTFLPLALAEGSRRRSLAAANGQLLAVDAATYRRAGGHAAVRADVLEDIALVRRVKATGGRGGMADGTDLASCRMYGGWPALREGYTKSLWAAFGSRGGAAGACGLLALLYVVPPVAALGGSRVGALGYLAGVAGRVLTARRTGSRVWPDSLAHPASVMLLGWLTLASWCGRAAGALSWKGRPLA